MVSGENILISVNWLKEKFHRKDILNYLLSCNFFFFFLLTHIDFKIKQ